ncbi:uncharacterized protein LOC108107228 [Drosophila eugracilis]|uniref:uncharacterized protein LOC108107228 n=1 Tax=Drosophila eugracilis TaxID=29029 RepID=UPI001BDB3D70|nr:uncharacterized protein LOC108107228 [Drosophila eugracilis]
MFRSAKNQESSKFQSAVMQRVVSVKPGNIRSVSTRPAFVPLISVFHEEKGKNVAKDSSVACDISPPTVSEKTTEKSKSKQKNEPQRFIKLARVKEEIVRKAMDSPKTVRAASSRTTGSTRSSTSNRINQFYIPLRISNGVTSRIRRPSEHGVFHYHLSQLEKTGFGECIRYPMKSVPAAELLLLRNGQRASYLERRYERSPDDKYNYPEATSWRYGWFHRESDPYQKRLPRRD